MRFSTHRNNKTLKMFLGTGILTLLVCSSSAVGQSEEGEPQVDHVVAGSVDHLIVGGNSMTRFVTSELSLYRDVVKNAPYSAEAVTETTQTLADGNQIYREMTAVLHRDSEGRTRREQTLTGYIPWASSPQGQVLEVIVINDPVAGVSYNLNPATRTAVAHEMSSFRSLPIEEVGHGTPGVYLGNTGDMTSSGTMSAQYQRSELGETEELGTRSIEGVVAEGTRSTITIPAGSIGNERPIEVVSERWYSSELHALVMSRHSDPRFGETVYQLKNIALTEPASDLFEVPSDYDITEPSTILEQLR